ncbi:MAG: hypothetical protein N2037_12815, partial [Acidimicrobiales bacterium]|nr:hypothetical protein [Acidimicrobiales bacterium]
VYKRQLQEATVDQTERRRIAAETPTARSAVIDLTRSTPSGLRTKVRIEPGCSPLETLSHEERMRLFIRVLCELVAYGELEEVSGA